MIIKNINLINFRNYETLNIDFNKKFNIIYGNNAQGKTNILEAIFLCTTGRSHRTSKENDLVMFGHNDFYVRIDIKKEDNETVIEYRNCDNKKSVMVNGVILNKIGKLIGNLSVVLFAPEDIMMLKEGPQERRRFLDIAISQTRPSYFYDLQQYKKILTNRNSVLKEIKNKPSIKDTLFVWNESLVKVGARIILNRREFINRLEGIIKPRHFVMTDGSENISLKYSSSLAINEKSSIIEIENLFLKKIQDKIDSDIIKSYTSTGPHRDDFEIYINDINVRNFGSQGQQRTAILSLKLAEIDIIKELTGELPVLLLDDFASELDKDRQARFLENLGEIQVIITSTHKEILKEYFEEDVNFIQVKNGKCL